MKFANPLSTLAIAAALGLAGGAVLAQDAGTADPMPPATDMQADDMGQPQDDAALASDVEAALAGVGGDISVSVEDGTVILTGTVDSDAAAQEAEAAAAGVAGVNAVDASGLTAQN